VSARGLPTFYPPGITLTVWMSAPDLTVPVKWEHPMIRALPCCDATDTLKVLEVSRNEHGTWCGWCSKACTVDLARFALENGLCGM
jgi:hypothetical protein